MSESKSLKVLNYNLSNFFVNFLLIILQLQDPSLFHEASLLHGKWVQSQSGKRFDVEGESGITYHSNGETC